MCMPPLRVMWFIITFPIICLSNISWQIPLPVLFPLIIPKIWGTGDKCTSPLMYNYVNQPFDIQNISNVSFKKLYVSDQIAFISSYHFTINSFRSLKIISFIFKL